MKPIVYTGKNSLASMRSFLTNYLTQLMRETFKQETAATGLIQSTVSVRGNVCHRVNANGVSINSGTVEELRTLNQVGPARAKQIIAGRPFRSLDDVNEALGADIVEKNRGVIALDDYVVLSADLHLAWSEALLVLPEILKQRLNIMQVADETRENIRRLLASTRGKGGGSVSPKISAETCGFLGLPLTCSYDNPHKRTWRSR